MLEIFILIGLYHLIAKNAEKKGQPRAFGWLGVGFWIGGEVIAFMIVMSQGKKTMMDMYPYALLGAVIGSAVAFIIVNLLPVNEEGLARQQRRFARPVRKKGSFNSPKKPRFPMARSFGKPYINQPSNKQENIEDSGELYDEYNLVKCPNCQSEFGLPEDSQTNYCPHCGQPLPNT